MSTVATEFVNRLSELTLEEKASLCLGSDFWHTAPVERLGIPAIMPIPYGESRRHTSPWRRMHTSAQRRTRRDDFEPGGRCAETAFLATLRDMEAPIPQVAV